MRILSATAIPFGEWPAPRPDSWQTTLASALVPAPGTDRLEAALRAPGALVVTTGQQPGLFTGPTYSIHKAVAAAAMARELSREWHRPVVPIYWLAGDDHDFAEASQAVWPDVNGRPVRWALPQRDARAVQLPMTEERLPAEVESGVAALLATLPLGEAHDRAESILRRHYRVGNTMHEAFRGAMAEILAPIGVLCLDPTVSVFKAAQVPILHEALERADELDQLLNALPPAGTGIAAGEGATLVFLRSSAGRDRLVVDGDGFKTRRSGETFPKSALLKLLHQEPERFSPNVLLRPLVESALLPTVSYLGGPGEYRYLTQQAAALYPALGVTRQTPVRRWSGTIVEEWADRLAERLDVSLPAVISDTGELAQRILRRDVPPDVTEAIASLRDVMQTAGDTLSTASANIDPGLVRSIAGRRDRMDEMVADLERRFNGHLRRKSDTAYAQYRRLRDALVPRDQPQERVYTGAVWLGRHGSAWLNAAMESAKAWAIR